MNTWHLGAAVSAMALIAGCGATPKTPIIDTNAPPTPNPTAAQSTTTKPDVPSATSGAEGSARGEQVANVEPKPGPPQPNAAEEEDDLGGGEEGGVFGGYAKTPDAILGNVPNVAPGGVVGGVVGGVPGGPSSSFIPDPPDGIFNVGHPRLSENKCSHPPAPDYPKAARDAKVEATIITSCIVETDGALSCRLLQSHPLFEKVFLDHLRKARVKPMTTNDGKPARVRCTQVYKYKIQ